MPKEIELPDGVIAEFPDEMSDDDIRSVLRNKFSTQTQAPTFDDPLMASAATLGVPEDFSIDRSGFGGVSTTAGAPQLREIGDGSFGRQVMQGIREVPSAAGELTETLIRPLLAPTEIEPRESLIGLTPQVVPTGARISEATGLPRAVSVPLSGIGRSLAGLGEFLTSPAGVADIGVAAIPGIGLLQRAKFVKDMAEGAGQSAGRLSALVESTINRPESISEEDAQSIAEESANTLLMLYGAGKLTSSQFSQITGVRAPLGRVLESERTRLSKDLAEQLKKSEPILPETSSVAPVRQLGIQQPSLTAEPFLQPGIQDLAGEAMREAQGGRLQVPGELSALETLRRELEPPQIDVGEPTRFAERIPGGGEAPYGKVSYQRTAEAPTTERTQNAIQQETARTVRDVRQTEVTPESARQVPAPESGKKASETRVGNEDLSVVVQLPGKLGDIKTPGYIQVDSVRGGKNEWSSNPNTLNNAGYNLPTTEMFMSLPQGKYTMPQALQMLKEKAINELETAVRINGREISGFNKGHLELAKEHGGVDAMADLVKHPENQGFMYNGKFISREQAATLLGEKGKLTSEQLKEIRASKGGVESGKETKVSQEGVLEPAGAATPAPDLVSRLESLKLPETGEGRLYSLPHPDAIKAIGVSTWNSAVDVAIASVKAGKAIAQAIDDALKYLRNQGKQFDETQARKNLEYQVTGEAGGPPPSKLPSTPASSGAPSPRGATLDDVYKIFEPAEKPRPGVKQTLVKAVESLRTGFSSRFRPIDKLAEDIAKEYGITSKKGIAGIFEQLKGSSGKAEADIYRFDRAVSNKVRGAEKDFSAYMFLRRSLDRLNQDAADRAAGLPARRSVSTYTIPELEAKLATLESNLGPDKLKNFQEAADVYQQHMDAALKLQVDSGRMSQEIYNAIKEGNAFYAPFKVLKYFEEGIKPEGAGRKVDTVADFTKAMEGIESPDFKLGDMLGAARQNIALSRILAEKNNTMRRFAELADQDVNGVFTQKLRPGQDAPLGMEVVKVLRNGRQERYAVNRDVAQAVQLFGDTANSFGARVLQMASIPFRLGATALNIPFQFSNLLADLPRAALVSKYGIRGVTDLVRYPLDIIDALYSSMLGNVVGYKNKLFLDFLDSGAAGTTIQEYLTPQGLKFQRTSIPETVAKKALYTLPDFAQAIEQMSKVLGVKRAMRITGAESGKELAAKIPEAVTEVRRFSGSPDFGRQGRWVEEARLNLLYMFLNARIQGVTSDLGRLVGRDGAKEAAKMWGKMGAAVGVPTAYLYSLNRSSEYADDYDKRPKQEKENYWLIPKDTFITNEQGEKMRDYWRIPKRESAKWIANSLEAAMDFAEKKDLNTFANWTETMIEEITPVNIQGDTFPQRLESVAASLNPIIKAPLEMATGRDMYRHRDIVPDQMQKASPSEQYTDRTAEVFKSLASKMPDVLPEVFHSPIMLESLVRNLSAGLVTQFLPRRPIEGRGDVENAALLQRFQALPYTDQEKFKSEMEALERNAADDQVRRYRNANTFVRENKSMDFDDKIEKAAKTYSGDQRQLERIIDLLIAERNGITSQERQVLALPVAQRAQFIFNQMEGLSADKKEELFRNYAIKRILTEGVASELNRLMQPASAQPQ